MVLCLVTGCLVANRLLKIDGDNSNQCSESAVAAATAATDAVGEEEGEYCHLGYPPQTQPVRYSILVEKLPSLLRLLQGAYRLGTAASPAASATSTMYSNGKCRADYLNISLRMLLSGLQVFFFPQATNLKMSPTKHPFRDS